MTAEERAVVEAASKVIEWWEKDCGWGTKDYLAPAKRLRAAVLALNKKQETRKR
jgi:hypothetical protein